MRIGTCLLLAWLLLWPHGAGARPATLLFEPQSGRVLQAEDHQAPRYPASLAKIMTAYLVLEAIENGGLKRAAPLTISATAASQSPVKLGLRKGRTITVEQALSAMILRSANDAAVVLAEALSGDEASFARAMSAKARALGMRATSFFNATGLPQRSQITTAQDMGLLAAALLRDFPDAFPLFSAASFSYGKRRYASINGWLTQYPGADGIKTGFTCAAGYNLVASAERDGQRLVAVVMGAATRGARSATARELMDQGFEALARTGSAAPPVGVLEARNGAPAAGVPSHVLPECASTDEAADELIEAGPYPGWGVIFGWFADRAKALEEIERHRERLGPLAAEGRPAVVAKARAGVLRYSALLVALAEEQSLDACRQLREAGDYCLRLRPEVLNNEASKWR